jgi:hypothetical protein
MPTYPTLLEQFIEEECTAQVRRLILDAERFRPPSQRSRQFEFNRFNLTLDFEAQRATVDDETDVSPTGTFDLPLRDLVAILERDGR